MKLHNLFEHDDQLRDYERKYHESGSEEDRKNWINARIRNGEFDTTHISKDELINNFDNRNLIIGYNKKRKPFIERFNSHYKWFSSQNKYEQEKIYVKALEELSVRARNVITMAGFTSAGSWLKSLPTMQNLSILRNMGYTALVHLIAVFNKYNIPVRPWPDFNTAVDTYIKQYTDLINSYGKKFTGTCIIGSRDTRRQVSPEEAMLYAFNRFLEKYESDHPRMEIRPPANTD